jgi:hypothetical protein
MVIIKLGGNLTILGIDSDRVESLIDREEFVILVRS